MISFLVSGHRLDVLRFPDDSAADRPCPCGTAVPGCAGSGLRASLRNARPPCKVTRVPELPDIAAYMTALQPRIVGQPLERVRLASPFVLRTVEPPLTSVEGRVMRQLRRVGKRIAIGTEND